MLIGKEVKKALDQLNTGQAVEFVYEGSPVMARLVDDASKLILSSTVYHGSSYIPKSVRNGITNKPPYSHPQIKTFLTIDESRYSVFLNYIGHSDSFDHDPSTILHEFGQLAAEWRRYLDENDKRDLIHVKVK